MKTSSLIISRILTVSFIVTGGIATSGAGCPAPGMDDGGDGDGDAIAFAFPQDGDVLNQADDADGDTGNGIQLDPPVRVAYEGSAGTELTLSSDQGETATATVDDDGFARFSGFTLNGSPEGTAITLTATDGEVSDEIEVEAITPDGVPLCTISAPSNGATLTEDQAINNDGFQTLVEVDCQNVSDGDDVVFSVNGVEDQTLPVSGNSVQATVTLPNTDAGNSTNSITISDPTETWADDTVTVTVDLSDPEPTVTITSPADGAAIGPGDVSITATSANVATASYDLDCSNDGDDATGVALTVNAGTGAITGTVTDPSFDPPNTCTLTVTGDDGNGNTATDSVTFTVSAVAATIAFPCDADSNGYLVASEDADDGTDMVMNCAVSVTATFDGGSWSASGQLTDDAGADVGAAQPLGNLTSGTAVTFDFAVPYGDDSAYELVVTFSETGGTTVPASAPIRVDTVAPTLTWFLPADGASLNASNDTSPGVAGFQLFTSLTTTGLVSTDTVTLSFDENDDGTIDVTVNCAVSGGACTSSDATLTDGSWVVEANGADAAGNAAVAAEISITVDATIPAIASPVDDNIIVAEDQAGNDDGRLNAIEAGDGQGNAVSDVTVNFDPAAGLEDGRSVNLVNGAATLASGGSVSGNSVTFSGVTLPQGSLELGVTGTDAAGNPLTAGATRSFNVDTVDPTLSLSSPAAGTLTATSQTISVLSDADGELVQVYDVTGGAETLLGSATVSSGGASIAVTLPEGDLDIEIRVTDEAGNEAVVPVDYTVDATPPALTLTLLSDPAVDQDPVAAGWQVDFTVDYNGLPLGGGNITLGSDLNMLMVGSVTVNNAMGSVTVRATFNQNGPHGVTAAASDGAGNMGVSNNVPVTIVTGAYDVIITSPVPVAGDLLFGAGDLPATVTFTSTAPDGSTVEFLIDGVAEPLAMITYSGGNGTVTWPAVDGNAGTLQIFVDDGVSTDGYSDEVDYIVDIGVPTVAYTTLVNGVQFNAADAQPATAGLQATVSVDVTECENGQVTITEGGSTLGSASVDASGAGTVAVSIVDLSDHNAATWTASCTDQVGNTASADVTTEVDTVAPAVPVVNLAVADAQRGQIDVTVTAPGDDGAAGDNVTLQVAASPDAISAASFAALFAQEFQPGTGGPIAEDAATAAGNDLALQTQSLAFGQDWNVAALAIDNVGNTSFAVATETGLRTDDNVYNHTDDGIGCDDRFPMTTAQPGDLNGDGFDDLVLAAPGEGDLDGLGCFAGFGDGAIYLFHGRSDLGTLDLGTPTRRLFFPRTVSGSAKYQLGRRIGFVDLDGDSRKDLVAYAEDQDFPFQVQLIVWYGVDTETGGIPDLVEATGRTVTIDGSGDPNYNISYDSVSSIGDVNGDGFEDLLLGARAFTANDLESVIVFGSGSRIAEGSLLSALTTTTLQETSTNAQYLGAATGLGKLDGPTDLYDDFAFRSAGRGILVVRGQASWPSTVDLATLPAADVLTGCTHPDCGNEIASGDIDADGEVDFVISMGAQSAAWVYLNNGDGTFPNTRSYRLAPPGGVLDGRRGVLAIGDINADTSADIVLMQRDLNGQPYQAQVWFGGTYPNGQDRTTPDVAYDWSFTAVQPGAVSSCGDLDNDGDDEVCYGSSLGDGSFVVRY